MTETCEHVKLLQLLSSCVWGQSVYKGGVTWAVGADAGEGPGAC